MLRAALCRSRYSAVKSLPAIGRNSTSSVGFFAMELSDPSPKIAVDREKNNGIEHRPASRVNLASAFWALSRVALQDQDAHMLAPKYARAGGGYRACPRCKARN